MEMKIKRERLKHLEDIEFKMQCLENGGVDNWGFYGEALEPYRKKHEMTELIEDAVSNISDAISNNIEEPAGSGAGYGLRDGAIDEISDIIESLVMKFIK